MIRIVFASLAVLVALTPIARAQCKNAPPVFNCADWERNEGRLVTKHALTVGLLGLDENSYIGDHSVIDGLDYSAALRKQCDAKVP